MAGAVVGIDHVQLAMPPGGEDVARGFYAGLLGLQELPKPPAMAARGGCWFGASGTPAGGVGFVHIGAEVDFVPARKAHPGLLVDDLAALEARLGKSGFSLARNTELPHVERGHVSDPFGNRLELVQT